MLFLRVPCYDCTEVPRKLTLITKAIFVAVVVMLAVVGLLVQLGYLLYARCSELKISLTQRTEAGIIINVSLYSSLYLYYNTFPKILFQFTRFLY